MLLRRYGTLAGWYGIKELSPVDGSTIDSVDAAMEDTATASVGGYPNIVALPDGFIFTQQLAGTYHFGNVVVTSTYPKGGSHDMIIIRYIVAAPPVARQGNIIPETTLNKIILYPNPTSNQIMVQNNNNGILGSVSIYDMSGKMIYKKFVGSFQATIDVSRFSGGMYYIKSDQLQVTIKFVKQ